MTPEISSYERLLEVEARQRQDPFWGRVHRQLDEIEAAAPTTSAEVTMPVTRASSAVKAWPCMKAFTKAKPVMNSATAQGRVSSIASSIALACRRTASSSSDFAI